MKVVITGGAGFLGKKLARRLLQGGIAGPSGKPEPVSELMLFDVGKASGPGLDDPRVKALAGDIANFATVQSVVQGAATVFHFAAVVSAAVRAEDGPLTEADLASYRVIRRRPVRAAFAGHELVSNPPP